MAQEFKNEGKMCLFSLFFTNNMLIPEHALTYRQMSLLIS